MEASIAEIENQPLPDADRPWKVEAEQHERERKVAAIREAGARWTPFTVAVNCAMFRDLLKNAVADVLEIELCDPLRPIRVKDSDDRRFVIMPLRT